MKRIITGIILTLAALFAAGCASADYASQEPATDRAVSENSETMGSSQVAEETATKPESKTDDGTGSDGEDVVSLETAERSRRTEEPNTVTERKVIRNADLQLEVGAPDEVRRKIEAVAEKQGGYVVTSSQRNTNAKMRGSNSVSMSLRVPAAKFPEALAEIRGAADRVVVETVTGRDVTEEFVDIEARLKTKRALEERFIEILKQARSVRDALEVERQLANVRTEIERIEGRRRFLENQTSFSTINVELRTPLAITASSSGFFYELKEAVSDGFEVAIAFILILVRVLIAMIPFLLLVVLPVFLLLRYFWRKYKKKRAARKIVEEELREEKIIDVE